MLTGFDLNHITNQPSIQRFHSLLKVTQALLFPRVLAQNEVPVV